MGAELWKELRAVEQKIYLHQYAVSTGFSANTTGARVIQLGVDASEWLDRAASERGDPIEALYERVERYSQLPLLLVFVMAANRYRSIKAGRRICTRGHSLTSRFKTIIKGFGFRWFTVTAAGGAEATLAQMTTTGIPIRVDAVLTEDWDLFAYGASNLFSRSDNTKKLIVSLYSAADIEDRLGLSQADFIFIAIASQPGMKYCGTTTAISLAHAGFGRSLIEGVRSKSRSAAARFLVLWRQEIREELVSNASGCLPVAQRHLAELLPSSFPDPDILNLFLRPVVSEPIAGLSSRFHPLDLDRLAIFARRNFAWGDPAGVLRRFSQRILPVLVVRALLVVQLALDASIPSPRPAILSRIIGERMIASTGHVRELCVALRVRRDTFSAAFPPPVVESWMNSELAKVQVWVPRVMIESVDPSFVLDFVCCT
ncbi:hypothetical protein C8F01DRAFT_1260525 [Mycena amicta]|nr:hypothetical protein C8F01DRAFT_1260525 [Mycena amicta]